MARLFDNASTERLEVDSAPVTAPKFSMAAWFDTDENATQTVIGLVNSGTANDRHLLLIGRGASNDQVSAFTDEGGTSAEALSSTTLTLNTRHHVGGVWIANNNRAVFLDGGGKGTNTTSLTPTGINRISIGRSGDTSPSAYMSGKLAEPAIWNVELLDEEFAALAKGLSPLLVRPENLVFYKDLIRGINQPFIGGTLIATGTVVADHPTIIYPTQPMSGFAAATPIVAPNVFYSQQFGQPQPVGIRREVVPY